MVSIELLQYKRFFFVTLCLLALHDAINDLTLDKLFIFKQICKNLLYRMLYNFFPPKRPQGDTLAYCTGYFDTPHQSLTFQGHDRIVTQKKS